MTSWAPGQITRLQAIIDRIPSGALHDRAASSQGLVIAALNRSTALGALVGCSCLDAAPSDELGPIPCTVCTLAPLPTIPTVGATPSTQPVNGPSPTPPGTTPGTEPGSPTDSGSSSSSPGGVLPSIPLPPITLPTLPSGLPTLPTLFPTGTSTADCLINLLGICIPKLP
jgi:hypothetical protein